MIRSMTGFGRAEITAGGWRCGVEIRSVNGRFLEVRMKMPPGLQHLEENLKNLIRSQCERGKIDCTLTLVPENAESAGLSWNKPLLEQYSLLLKNFQEVLGSPVQVTLGNLITIKDLFSGDGWTENPEGLEPLLTEAVGEGMAALLEMRSREGSALKKEMEERTASLKALMAEIVPLTKKIPEQYARRLKENLARLMDGTPPNEDRIIQEIAIMADRCDVSEEITRFNTHLDQLETMLEQGGALGRKFDFLLQEINREANTLASKCNEAAISGLAVEIKSELEKLREQIQNVE